MLAVMPSYPDKQDKDGHDGLSGTGGGWWLAAWIIIDSGGNGGSGTVVIRYKIANQSMQEPQEQLVVSLVTMTVKLFISFTILVTFALQQQVQIGPWQASTVEYVVSRWWRWTGVCPGNGRPGLLVVLVHIRTGTTPVSGPFSFNHYWFRW